MKEIFLKTDEKIVFFLRSISEPLARISIFIVFFWFGFLKLFDLSPANPLVSELLQKTMPFITFGQFIILFGLFEMLIGVLFLIPKMERLSIALLFIHMFTTALPLFMIPTIAWQSAFVPTLEGQYIIKNIVIIALAIGLGAKLNPIKKIPANNV